MRREAQGEKIMKVNISDLFWSACNNWIKPKTDGDTIVVEYGQDNVHHESSVYKKAPSGAIFLDSEDDYMLSISSDIRYIKTDRNIDNIIHIEDGMPILYNESGALGECPRV